MPDSIKQYLKTVEARLKTGIATEHTYRAALAKLIESQLAGVTAINEPKRIECGAPDLTILKNDFIIGYVEAKDVGLSLDEAAKTEQLKRYLDSLDNLILTNYLEFRWYVEGDLRHTAALGALLRGNKIKRAGDVAELQNLLAQFLGRRPLKLSSSQEVARRMAKLTHMIRTIVVQAFAAGQESPLVKDLRQALARTLLPGLDAPERVAEFADIYAQTIAYGLFAARCNHTGGSRFKRSTAAAEIPKTNPFLRRLFTVIAGPDLADEPYIGFVKDLVQLLDNADMEAILSDFGRRTRQEDPIVHFYETFLATYDPRLRELRGVYYTPEPVVSYIVRSVDHLLKTRFNLPDGLTDTATLPHNGQHLPKMLLLDPAAGTGTFLYQVIEQIREKFGKQGNVGMWSGYVKEHLLKKLHGFELLMVPYAVAHFKLALQLAGQDLDEAQRPNWAYDFGSDERLKIYLTNTLEEVEEEVQTLFGLYRIITEEAKAAAEIKRDLPILVVMGNPPYSVSSLNKGEWIEELMATYKKAVRSERNIQPLSDDYIKFIRFAHDRIDRTGQGIIGFVTNHAYLSGLIHRGMREELLKTFSEIYVANLHGNTTIGETTPDGGLDENVFDIRQGVAIALFVKDGEHSEPAKVSYIDLWGKRNDKYTYLMENDISTSQWQTLNPQPPHFFFIPKDFNLQSEYEQGWKILDIFLDNSLGIEFGSKEYLLSFDDTTITHFVKNVLLNPNVSNNTLATDFRLRTTSGWRLNSLREHELLVGFDQNSVVKCTELPFDVRYTYHSQILRRPQLEVLRNLHFPNLALLTVRQSRTSEQGHFFAVNTVYSKDVISIKDRATGFPLFLYPDPNKLFDDSPWPEGKEGRTPNLNPKFIKEVEARLGLSFSPEGATQTSEVSETSQVFTPEDIFHYIYAIFHSPTYRDRYAEFLKIDFPRVPLTGDRALFAALVKLGAQLVKLHLLEQVPPSPAGYPIRGDDTVAKGHPRYDESRQRVYINKTQYFEGVAPEVWEFYVGGYQVLDKWLKDRRGRQLTYNDLSHYQKIVAALGRTIELMEAIDDTIPDWPLE